MNVSAPIDCDGTWWLTQFLSIDPYQPSHSRNLEQALPRPTRIVSCAPIGRRIFQTDPPLLAVNDEHSPLPAFARGGRSPGLRPGGRSQSIGGNCDPSPAEIASSPGSEYFGATGGDGVSPGGTRGQGAGGVKRTRSIMQRFKAMVS